MIKKLTITLLLLAGVQTLVAAPSKADLQAVSAVVEELMKPELDAMKSGKKTKAEVAKTAMALASQADSAAAKQLLCTDAFSYYVKAGEYESADAAFDALLAAVPDFPQDDQQSLLEKALYPVPLKSAPELRARLAQLKASASQRAQLKKLLALYKSAPRPATATRIATTYASLNDWPHALEHFVVCDNADWVKAAKLEQSLATQEKKQFAPVADAWWAAAPTRPDSLVRAFRAHAAALYTSALPTLTGLTKLAVEKRIKETEEDAGASVSDSSGSSSASVSSAGIAKFVGVELVGNTVKLEKGVLSNFSGGSYGKIKAPFEPKGAAIEAVVDFTTGPVVGTSGILGGIGGKDGFTPFYTSANQLVGFVSFSGSAWDLLSNAPVGLELKPSTNYRIKCTWDKKSYAWFVWSKSWKPLKKFESDKPVFDGLELQLGTNRGANAPFNGIIDLNRSYIKLDGKLWWEGVKGAYKNANR